MKLGDIGPLIWVIIFVMISLAKGWSKLQRSVDESSSKAEDAPPAVRPKPQPASRPRLQPLPAPPPPPAYGAPPQRRVRSRAIPRTETPPVVGDWKATPDEVRRFVQQLSGRAQTPPPPSPPPVSPSRLRKAEPPPAPAPEPSTAAPVAAQAVATPTPPTSTQSSQWMEALRDRDNIRNIVIAAEIIGPPKAESV